jgi:signal transduction histidine kinase
VTRRVASLPVGEENAFIVAARGVRAADGSAVVLAAQSLESAQSATDVLVRLLLVGYPVVLLLVAATSYWLTGRALAPVDTMRRRVADIAGGNAAARVPVPPSRDAVAELAETMNAMLGRLAAAGEAQRRFVADASHELRSPLATIRAAHEVALAHPDVSDWKAVSDDVLADVERLEALVDDLLFLARSDERGAMAVRTDVDLDDLVADECRRLSRVPGLEVTLRVRPVRVQGDPQGLARLLRNLADNAARYARERIELRLQSCDGEALVDVVDDGPGIPDTEREHVFERFVRLDSSRGRPAGGAGLGLSIAREIARAHGGELSAADHEGGAHFRLRLPLP